MANPRTIARLEARIMERAAYCIAFELNDPRITLITLVRCELTNDLANAKLHYSVIGSRADQAKCQRALDSAAGFVQRQVGRILRTRRIPRITWKFDESIRAAAEMDLKIQEALRKDQEIKGEDAELESDSDLPETESDSESREPSSDAD